MGPRHFLGLLSVLNVLGNSGMQFAEEVLDTGYSQSGDQEWL